MRSFESQLKEIEDLALRQYPGQFDKSKRDNYQMNLAIQRWREMYHMVTQLRVMEMRDE